MEEIQVLIVDDHRLFRQGVRQLCETFEDIVVVGEASNATEAVTMAAALTPDVVLMDLGLPDFNGVEAVAQIKENRPETHVIILTMYMRTSDMFGALKAGADGYLLKDTDSSVLVDAIRHVYQGQAMLDPFTTAEILREIRRPQIAPVASESKDVLTEIEFAVLRQVARGASNKEIADELHFSLHTVSNTIRTIFEKTHVSNRTQAALYALRHDWVSLDEISDKPPM